jgi:nitrous oxidase accessory protein NosD
MLRTRTLTTAVLASLALWVGIPPAVTRADTLRCQEIRSVPFTIDRPGVYCLARPISTPIEAGVAILIAADDVTLDLAGFTLEGTADTDTKADGIVAEARRNVTVRDGTVRGFLRGVRLASVGGHLVEGVRAHGNFGLGIGVSGHGSIIRRNQVVATGGGKETPVWTGIGAAGPGVRIIDNDVIDTVDPGPGFAVDAINVFGAHGGVIEGNRVANQLVPPHVFGITVFDSSGVLVVNNRIVNFPDGITYLGSTGKYRDNLTFGVASPFDGGTDAGNNN